MRTRARIGVASLGVAALVAVPAPAQAQYTHQAAAAATWSTSSMVAPTNVAASVTCHGGTYTATITWTMTATSYATGYLLLTQANGTQQANRNVTGRTTVSTTYTLVKGVLYQFALESGYNNWTSPATAYTAPVNC